MTPKKAIFISFLFLILGLLALHVFDMHSAKQNFPFSFQGVDLPKRELLKPMQAYIDAAVVLNCRWEYAVAGQVINFKTNCPQIAQTEESIKIAIRTFMHSLGFAYKEVAGITSKVKGNHEISGSAFITGAL